LHWYYRVEHVNNRHCWYLHAEGVHVRSRVGLRSRVAKDEAPAAEATGKSLRAGNFEAAAPEWRANRSEKPVLETAAQPSLNFAARWVDLPKMVDLNSRNLALVSNGYAVERGPANSEEFPSTWSVVAEEGAGARPTSPNEPDFGAISLAGAAALALLLLSEGLIRVARASAWQIWRPLTIAGSAKVSVSKLTVRTSTGRRATTREAHRSETGSGELRRVLHRVDAGLKPPRSFAPSGSFRKHSDKSIRVRNNPRANSGPQRLTLRSFGAPQWAPL
jgi:hypothetical protein